MSEWQMPQNKISMATSFGFGSRLSMVMGASGLPAAGKPQAGIFFISVAPGWRKPATGVEDKETIAGAKPTRTGWAVQDSFTMLSRRSVETVAERCTCAVRGAFPRSALHSRGRWQVTRRDRSLWTAPGGRAFPGAMAQNL